MSMHQLILLRLVLGGDDSEQLRHFHWMIKMKRSPYQLMGDSAICLLEWGPSF
jgi:hypothetical protein